MGRIRVLKEVQQRESNTDGMGICQGRVPRGTDTLTEC